VRARPRGGPPSRPFRGGGLRDKDRDGERLRTGAARLGGVLEIERVRLRPRLAAPRAGGGDRDFDGEIDRRELFAFGRTIGLTDRRLSAPFLGGLREKDLLLLVE